MYGQAATLDDMSKKKVEKPPEPAPREPVLGLRLSGNLVNLVRELSRRNRRTLTAEVSIALENHLAAAGLWPPEGEDEDA